jgi:hypothetical protein
MYKVTTDGQIEKAIWRLSMSLIYTQFLIGDSIDEALKKGKRDAERMMTRHVYMHPQGPNTRYERTYTLHNSVRATRYVRGSGQAGIIYLSRQPFTSNKKNRGRYYPPYVEGKPLNRHFWEATKVLLRQRGFEERVKAANLAARSMVT